MSARWKAAAITGTLATEAAMNGRVPLISNSFPLRKSIKATPTWASWEAQSLVSRRASPEFASSVAAKLCRHNNREKAIRNNFFTGKL